MNHFITVKMECPKCGYPLDRATATNHDNSPKPGDLSVCLACVSVLQFGDGEMVLIHPFLLATFPASTRAELLQMQAAIRRLPPEMRTWAK